MATHRVYLALGTNLGNRRANLERAAARLGERMRIENVSPIYETEPVGVREQPRFLNQVVAASTDDLSPREILDLAKAIEREMGREPLPYRYGPRLIDVDLLFYDDRVQPGADPALPHPRLHERAFVLAPLADIAPDLRHPVVGATVAELLGRVGREGVRRADPSFTDAPEERAGQAAPATTGVVIGGKTFLWGSRTYVVGILNVTPDSFSGDGVLRGDGESWLETAVEQGLRFAAEGADILDVGGESTRPGAEPVPAEEEIRRVLPVIERLARAVDAPVSIDTSKAEVAEAALGAGATIVNDVWGLRLDPAIAAVVARRGAAVILMHNRSQPRAASIDAALGGRYVGVQYANLVEDVKRELGISLKLALGAGVHANRIVLDPGIGFGKTIEQNLELLDRVADLKTLGYPILIGPSRKSFIGYTLGLPPDERVEGTAATVAIGIARGADLVRVHDVKEMARVARMTDAIVRRGPAA